MTQQVKTLCSYLLNSHQLCKKNIKLSYLKPFIMQKSIIFTKKFKTCMQNAVLTKILMSVNGKNDVIRTKTLFSEQTIAGFIKYKTFWWENTRGMHLKCFM